MRHFFVLSLFAVALCLPVVAQDTPDTIRPYCADLNKWRKSATPVLLADASDKEKSEWKRIATDREFDALPEALFQHTNLARVYSREKKVVFVEYQSTTGAGDWTLSADYCYRPDGTLASIRSELRTFAGEMIVTRNKYFAVDGTLLSEDEQFLDLRTRKPRKPGRDFQDQQAPVVQNVSEWPFTDLLATSQQ